MLLVWFKFLHSELKTTNNNMIILIYSTSNLTIDEELYFEQFKFFEKIFHKQNDEWHTQELDGCLFLK